MREPQNKDPWRPWRITGAETGRLASTRNLLAIAGSKAVGSLRCARGRVLVTYGSGERQVHVGFIYFSQVHAADIPATPITSLLATKGPFRREGRGPLFRADLEALADGIFAGQKRRAVASLMTTTGDSPSASRSVKLRPRTMGMLSV